MMSNSLLVEQPAQGRDGAGDGSMGATVAVILQPTPGKQQQLQADIAEATRILESTGGHVRTWQAIFAGPRAGTVLLASAMPDMAAFAASFEKLQASSEWQQFQAKASADGNATVLSQSLLVELAVA